MTDVVADRHHKTTLSRNPQRSDHAGCAAAFQGEGTRLDFGVPATMIRLTRYFKAHPAPQRLGDVSDVMRRITGQYSDCLTGSTRRSLFVNATAAKVFRNEWQCATSLSPKRWKMRVKGWWEVDEVGRGCAGLVKGLQANHAAIKAEAVVAMVDKEEPEGGHVVIK